MRMHQKGVVAPLIAACLLGLMALMYTLIFDNYIVSLETTKFRSKVQKICSDVAEEAPLHADSLRLFATRIKELSDNQLPSWFEVLSANLTMGTMPTPYLSTNTNVQDRVTSCSNGNQGFTVSGTDITSFVTSIIGSTTIKFGFESNLCSNNFKDKWGTLNVSKDYHAGTFVGCEVKGRIRTFFSPREVPAGIAKRELDEGTNDAQPRTRLVYSRFGFWKFPWTDDNPTTEPQGLVIAIAPQIAFEPNNPTLSTPAIHNNQFFANYLNRNNYLGIVTNDPSDSSTLTRLNPPTTALNHEQIIAPPLFDSALSDTEKRSALFRLFAGEPTVLRQRISSALIELASRDGMLRSNTAVLLANPRTEIGATIDVNPPIILRDQGEDLRADNISSTPLLFTNFNFDGNAVAVNPYYSLTTALPPDLPDLPAATNPPTIQAEFSSLISRFPSLGLHLDSSDDWHSLRLFRDSNSILFPFSSLLNGSATFMFESPIDYSWGENENEGYYSFWENEFESGSSNHSDYFDRLNHFNNATTVATDVNNLNVSQLARTLGPSVKCPYSLERTGMSMICSGFQGFNPDIEGVLKAWLGLPGEDTITWPPRNNTNLIPNINGTTGSRFNAVKLPGLYSNSFTQWQSNRPSQLVLILHSHLFDASTSFPTEQVQYITPKITSIIDSLKLPTDNQRPITIIYIPTRTEDSSQSVIENLANTFSANICSPSERRDFKRGNVLIPIVHGSESYTNLGCLAESFPCTKKPTLHDVWECMLEGSAPENFAKQIFSQTIMRTTRIF